MASPLIKDATVSASELLDGARKYLKVDPEATAALQLAAVSKALADIAPGEEPGAAAERLSVKLNRPALKGGYLALLWYYEDSLDPRKFCVHKEIDREDHFGVAEDILRMLHEGHV